MEAFLNAIMGDIANRFVSFLMDKCSELTTSTTDCMREHDLQRLLLRIRVIVEEAERRYISNPVMVYQLNLLRKEMYKGYFTMDYVRNEGNKELKAKEHNVSHSFSMSKFNRAKRLFFSTGSTNMDKDIQHVLDNLNKIMANVSDFVKMLNSYPPLCRQPYSMHLYVGKCMFGRQMEIDRVMDFLLQTESPSTPRMGATESPSRPRVGVLPIVGPTFVGKSTLVAHIKNDESVCKHFGKIVVTTRDESMATLRERGVIMHQDNALSGNDRVLNIIEFSGDVDEVEWNSFYSSACSCLRSGSKIIITSRSSTIQKFGTTQALVLNFLPLEAYWYFFKILTFGSVDSNDHPKLEAIAMEMARGMNGSFIGAHVNSDLLRENLIAQYWYMYLEIFKDNIQRNVYLYGENPYILTQKNKPMSHRINGKDKFVVYNQYRACLEEDNVPVITTFDVLTERVKCEGEFEVLIWKSHIVPFKYYIADCIIEKSQLE